MAVVMKLLAAALLLASTPTLAAPLTIKQGETWLFGLKKGEPTNARRVAGSAKAAKGQVKATLSPLMGTTLTMTNASSVSYTFRAELIGAKSPARTCALPANGKPVMEFWPVKASAVRLSGFKPAPKDGSCPSP